MRTVLALLLLTATVAACAGTTPSPSAPGPSQPGGTEPGGGIDATGDWLLTAGTVDGAALPLDPKWPVTLSVEGSRIGGTSACNSYGADIVVAAGELRLGDVSMTLMGCEEPVMAIESAYVAALARVRQATRDGDALILAGDGVELRFEPIPPIPTADLVGTMWTLETLIDGAVASSVGGEPATLVLGSDGRFEGSTGCRSFGGSYVEAVGQIVATELVTDDRACAAPLDAQDDHVLAVLGDGFGVAIEGDRLTLTSAGGLGLVYVAAR